MELLLQQIKFTLIILLILIVQHLVKMEEHVIRQLEFVIVLMDGVVKIVRFRLVIFIIIVVEMGFVQVLTLANVILDGLGYLVIVPTVKQPTLQAIHVSI